MRGRLLMGEKRRKQAVACSNSSGFWGSGGRAYDQHSTTTGMETKHTVCSPLSISRAISHAPPFRDGSEKCARMRFPRFSPRSKCWQCGVNLRFCSRHEKGLKEEVCHNALCQEITGKLSVSNNASAKYTDVQSCITKSEKE